MLSYLLLWLDNYFDKYFINYKTNNRLYYFSLFFFFESSKIYYYETVVIKFFRNKPLSLDKLIFVADLQQSVNFLENDFSFSYKVDRISDFWGVTVVLLISFSSVIFFKSCLWFDLIASSPIFFIFLWRLFVEKWRNLHEVSLFSKDFFILASWT